MNSTQPTIGQVIDMIAAKAKMDERQVRNFKAFIEDCIDQQMRGALEALGRFEKTVDQQRADITSLEQQIAYLREYIECLEKGNENRKTDELPIVVE